MSDNTLVPVRHEAMTETVGDKLISAGLWAVGIPWMVTMMGTMLAMNQVARGTLQMFLELLEIGR